MSNIESKRQNLHFYNPDDLTIIGIDEGGQDHPLYDERVELPVDEGLMRSILAKGVLQNITVVTDGDKLLVVTGRQRVRATRAANEMLRKSGKKEEDLILIPARKARGDDGGLIQIGVMENELRREDSALVKARKAQRMLDRGKNEDDVALAFGVTKPAVANYLKLLELDEKVQEAVDKGVIAYTRAIQLHGYSKEEQRKRLAEAPPAPVKGGADKAKGGKKGRKTQVRGARGPNKNKVRKVFEHESVSDSAQKMLAWVLGEISTEEAQETIKGFPKEI